MKDSARAVAALAASSFLVISFCSLGISAAGDTLAPPHSETSDSPRFADRVTHGEAYSAVQERPTPDRSNRRAVRGETKPGSKIYPRSSTRSPRHSRAVQALLFPALVALGMSSAAVFRTNFLRRPREVEDVQGRPAATFAGLPSPSNGMLVAAVALAIIASSLAAPTNQQAPLGSDKSPASGPVSEALSSTAPTATSEVTAPDVTPSSYPIHFDYKGKRFTVYVRAEDASAETLRELQERFDPPAVSEDIPAEPNNPVSFFTENSTNHIVYVPDSVRDCPACIKAIGSLGRMVAEYQRKLDEQGAEQLTHVAPYGGLPPVRYTYKEGKTRCTIGFMWENEKGFFKDGTTVARFSAGDTEFQVQMPKLVEEALGSKRLGHLVEFLQIEKPKISPIPEEDRSGTPAELMTWGYGLDYYGFDTPFSEYAVFMPEYVRRLEYTNKAAWTDLLATFKVTLEEAKKAFVRQSMQ